MPTGIGSQAFQKLSILDIFPRGQAKVWLCLVENRKYHSLDVSKPWFCTFEHFMEQTKKMKKIFPLVQVMTCCHGRLLNFPYFSVTTIFLPLIWSVLFVWHFQVLSSSLCVQWMLFITSFTRFKGTLSISSMVYVKLGVASNERLTKSSRRKGGHSTHDDCN